MMFCPIDKYLKVILLSAKRNRALNAAIKFQIHHALAYPRRVKELFDIVLVGLNDCDFDQLRPFLMLFEVMLEVPDPVFSSQREKWLEAFINAAKVYQDYYKFTETIIYFILKISGRSTWVREWFYNNREKWHYIIAWFNNRPAPGPTEGQKMYKNRMLNTQMAYTGGNMKINYDVMLSMVRDLFQQNAVDLSHEMDLDRVDFQDFKFVKGDTVTMFNRKSDSCGVWRVNNVLDEMIFIESFQRDQHNRPITRWMKTDTDKILYGDVMKDIARFQVKKEAFQRMIQMHNQRREQQMANQQSRGRRRDRSGEGESSDGQISD